MSILRNVRRNAAALKPPYGSPCNRCGACCEATLCPLAQHVMGRRFDDGPCPALLGEPGATSCGIVADPARWAPFRTVAVGTEPMREAALILIGTDPPGCDARINGESDHPAFRASLHAWARTSAGAIRRAKRLWGVK